MSLLHTDEGARIRVPLLPLVREFHVDAVRSIINQNSLVCLSDSTSRFVIASIVCLNFCMEYPESLIVVLCSDENNQELFTKILVDFSIPTVQIRNVVTGQKRKSLDFPKQGIVFMSSKVFTSMDIQLKKVDLKLLVIDEAEKANGKSPNAKVVIFAMQHQSNFRTLGLASQLDLRKPVGVQAIVSNLAMTQIYIKDIYDKKFADSILLNDFLIKPVQCPQEFSVLVRLMEEGMEPILKKLYAVSLLDEITPKLLIYGQLDEWKKKAADNALFHKEVNLAYSLLESYKHLVFSGSHPFYLHVNAVQARFVDFKEAFEKEIQLKTLYNSVHSIYSKLEELTDNKAKINVFTKFNPKYGRVVEHFEENLKLPNKNVAIVAWSPFTVTSLETFCKLVLPSKNVHASIFSSSIEESEFQLNSERDKDYSRLEGFTVDLLIKTGHVDKRSKRVFKYGIAMDICSTSLYRMSIALGRTYIQAEPHEELVPHRYFNFDTDVNSVKYQYFEKAFRMEKVKDGLKQFSVKAYPHEFSTKFQLKGYDCLIKQKSLPL